MVTRRVYTEHKDITYLLVAILLNYVVGLVYINIDSVDQIFEFWLLTIRFFEKYATTLGILKMIYMKYFIDLLFSLCVKTYQKMSKFV